jgi:very-short-patch-repair endonuclease
VRIAQVLVTRPELTAIEFAPRLGGDAIDAALRSRMVTLPAMYRALNLTPGRAGNRDRRQLLLDSRGQPWSALERLAHRHLRAAGITHWTANVPITINGRTSFQDIAMEDCPVSAEFDGKVHLRPAMFESDRVRGNYLLLAGREVLHFTWAVVHDEPDVFVSMTRRAIDRHRGNGR